MKDAHVRRVQIAFLVILTLSAAQVLWWIIDQSLYARAVHDQWQTLYEADVMAASALLDYGARRQTIEGLFPHLEIDAGGAVQVSPLALARLAEDRRAHINQYAWEGGFFLLVIVCAASVVLRAVRRDAQLRRWQSNFLAAVSHELKSPLASLQLAAETLELRDPEVEQRRRLVARILGDAERLGATVANVLDTHRLDRDVQHFDRQTIPIADAVAESFVEIDFRAREAGVELRSEVQPELAIEADPVGVRAVLRNLLDNALKATLDLSQPAANPSGASEDGSAGRVTVRAEAVSGGVQLQVVDNGIGFAPEEAKRIFEKFYRVGDELRRTRPGSGLGLYTTRRFVEMEGGSVKAHSDGVGHGAFFTVFWPAEPNRRALATLREKFL